MTEKALRELLSQMTLEEKLGLCFGDAKVSNHGIPRLGIRPISMNDGPRGIRLEDGRTSTALPCGLSLACTFRRDAAKQYGEVLGAETRDAGYQAILGPGLNLMRSPLCGRNFEYAGEDPVLAGEISAAYIKGVQSTGVAACPKHYALNNQETCRHLSSVNIDERSMRELYLRGFEIVVKKSEPWMLMSSYNKVNGVHVSECAHLQQEILKDEWGFDGVVVSDWGSTHCAYRAAVGGLDLEMNGGEGAWFNHPLRKLVEQGFVSPEQIDEKALRLLRLMDRAGCLAPKKEIAVTQISTPEHRQLAKTLAQKGMVLLQNNGILPLNRKKIKKLAVVGPAADFHHDIGTLYMCGGSGAVHPEYEITPLDGLREYLGNDAEIIFVPGEVFTHTRTIADDLIQTSDGTPGFVAQYFASGNELNDPQATPILEQVEKHLDWVWGNMSSWVAVETRRSVLDDLAFGVRMRGFIVPKHTGRASIGLYQSGTCNAKVYIDGKLTVDNQSDGYQNGISLFTLETSAGKPIPIEITCIRKWANSQLGLRLLYIPDSGFTLDAVRDADAVLYFGGSNHLYDKEAIGISAVNVYADMPDFKMPGKQDELISQLLELNPNTVVTLIGGSPQSVETWADRAPAVLEAWYPGMESGRALAEVLFGDAEPGGRLACTWAKALDDYPCHRFGLFPGITEQYNAYSDYLEGIFVGYRFFDKEKLPVRYPFGHGLGYTQFEFKLGEVAVSGREVSATIEVVNVGKRSGEAIIQLYLHADNQPLPRPEQELADFADISLAPGETGKVTLKLTERDFSSFDEAGKLHFIPGKYELRFGTSSREIFAKKTIQVD